MLAEVVHPAKGSKSIVELGMVDSIAVGDDKVTVTLAFPKRRDPLSEYLVGSTRATIIRNVPQGTEVEVKTVVKEEAPKRRPDLISDLKRSTTSATSSASPQERAGSGSQPWPSIWPWPWPVSATRSDSPTPMSTARQFR